MFAAVEERAASGEPLALRNLALARTALRLGPARDRAGVAAARARSAPGQPFLILRGKGDKERLVPISTRAAAGGARLAARMSPATSPWLFPSGKRI